jgi:hypothetical protein
MMAYIDPDTVVAPRSRVTAVEVVHNAGEWSVARLEYDGEECLGIRWNGNEREPGIGNPQSHGRPTWFVVPDELAEVIRAEIEKFGNSKHAVLVGAYKEMAEDLERENEAQEWCEGLIGDATGQEG